MTNNQTYWQELCVQLYAALKAHPPSWDDAILLDRVKAALRRAQSELKPMTDTNLQNRPSDFRELCADLVKEWEKVEDGDFFALAPLMDRARAALARWGSPSIEPVPVSERLPGPEDCDADGRCWCGSGGFIDETGDMPVEMPASWELREPDSQDDWVLPHYALPVPTHFYPHD
jgi:hypothetical protein